MPYSSEVKYLEKVQDITLDEATLKYGQAHQPWTDDLDTELTVMYNDDITLRDIANHFGRTVGEVESRVKELGCRG